MGIAAILDCYDTVASVCQILMIVSICIFRNRESKKLCIFPFVIMVTVCYLLYVAGWIAYYNGMTNAIVILGLTIPPCLAFLFFEIDRKNSIALIPISIFCIESTSLKRELLKGLM